MQSRNWCFTAFDFLILPVNLPSENFSYLVYQVEVCPNTSKQHIQGFAQLKRKQRLSWMSRELVTAFRCSPPHLETMKGTAQQARQYSMKEESRLPGSLPIETGTFCAGQGARMDLTSVAQLCADGTPLSSIASQCPETWIRHHRGITSLSTILAASRMKPRSSFALVYIWGPSGCGKTTAVRARWPDAFWMTETDRGWMDSYAGESVIVIDDFASKLPLPFVLRLCQPQPFSAECKGLPPVPIQATTVVMTSNFPPEEHYCQDRNQTAWLSRCKPDRNGHVIHCTDGKNIVWPQI